MEVPSSAMYAHPALSASLLNPDVDEFLEKIISTALAIQPENRYQNAVEFLNDLEKVSLMGNGQIANPETAFVSREDKLPDINNQQHALALVEEAHILAKSPGKLKQAADIMEEAFQLLPDLKKKYEYQVKLWHRGVSR